MSRKLFCKCFQNKIPSKKSGIKKRGANSTSTNERKLSKFILDKTHSPRLQVNRQVFLFFFFTKKNSYLSFYL